MSLRGDTALCLCTVHSAFVPCFAWCLCAVLFMVPLCGPLHSAIVLLVSSLGIPFLTYAFTLYLCALPLHCAFLRSFAQCHCFCALPLRYAVAPCLCAVPLRGASALCLCTVPLYGSLHGSFVRSFAQCYCEVIGMVPLCGPLHGALLRFFAWFLCAVFCTVPLCGPLQSAFVLCLHAVPLRFAFAQCLCAVLCMVPLRGAFGRFIYRIPVLNSEHPSSFP